MLFLANAPYAAGKVLEGPDPELLTQGLAAAGFRVVGRPLNRHPSNPLARWGTFYAGFDPLRALTVLLLDRRVDVIVSVGESNVVAILWLAKLLRFKPRIVLREVSPLGWPMRDRAVDFVVPRVDRILALTPHQERWIRARWPAAAPVDVVGFAIDEAFFRPSPSARGGTGDGGYILAVGDDGSRDYPGLIEACRTLPYRLMLRTSSNPPVPEAMRDRVTLVGRVSYLALRDLYDAAAIVVVPLRPIDHPGGITALFEAMAMGRAVVASDAGSTRHAIEDGRNGALVPVGDTAAMTATLQALMENPERRAALGANARATIEARFSYAGYVQRFADSLRALTAASPTARRR